LFTFVAACESACHDVALTIAARYARREWRGFRCLDLDQRRGDRDRKIFAEATAS
jgi:hypothetical protein